MDPQRYWRDGYCFPTRVMSTEQAREAGTELVDLLTRWHGHPSLRRPLSDYCRANFNLVTRWGSALARYSNILDAVQAILGPNLVCWMLEVIIKEPRSDKHLSMHQDFTYWGMDDADKGLTVWLALTPATPENGCMRFVRGSHLRGQVEHRDTFAADNLLSRGQEVTVDYDREDIEYCRLEPGEISVHHSLMFHDSGPNQTPFPRIGAVMRYLSVNIKQLAAAHNYGILVRGKGEASNFSLLEEPREDFSAEALALHERVTTAQEEHFTAGAISKPRYVT